VIEYRVLGPFEVAVDGHAAAIPAGKPAALLARLALEPGRVVSAGALVDALWIDPPPSAAKLVQVHVSKLRKALPRDAVETVGTGYRVSGSTDLARFEELVAAAADQPAARAEQLAAALALWRGPALAEFGDEPFAVAAARRLEELRLHALESRIDAQLELGEEERAIPELEALVAAEPLRERPLRQLMLALYRTGRQADALARYREGRRRIVEELGIEPGPALQELERAILRHAPELAREAAGAKLGPIVCAGAELVPMFAPLCAPGQELVVVEVVEGEELAERSAALAALEARTAAFTSAAPGEDLARFAAVQDAELLAVAQQLAPPDYEALLAAATCTLVLVPSPRGFVADAPVLVPFAGDEDEWAALELGGSLARAHDVPLRLVGSEAGANRRDASKLLASASLTLQRFTGAVAEPVLVPRGAEGILRERASAIVTSLPAAKLDPTRRELVERAPVPVLLVRGALGADTLAPAHTLTRYGWTLA
jgi:DNA-binding SARP family transcriptional activator